MAIQVTLDFTDAQWELIKEHLCLPNILGMPQYIVTVEELKSKLEIFVRHSVQQCVIDANIRTVEENAKTAFDV